MIFAFQMPLEVGKTYQYLELTVDTSGTRRRIPFKVMRQSSQQEWIDSYEGPEELQDLIRRHNLSGYKYYYLLSVD